jgi:hypothetical protein
LGEKVCAATCEMIQQKHTFLIEIESVRRMFHAKPSMNVIVVQLLVDLSSRRKRKEIDLRSRKVESLRIGHQVVIRLQLNREHRSL